MSLSKRLRWAAGRIRNQNALRVGYGTFIALLLFSVAEAYRIQSAASQESLSIYRRYVQEEDALYRFRRAMFLGAIAARGGFTDRAYKSRVLVIRDMPTAPRDVVHCVADHIDDLRRCAWGLGLARLCTPYLTRSPVVREDSVRSVRAAFTAGELKELARAAGLQGARVTTRFPARMLLEWNSVLSPPRSRLEM